MKPMETKRQKQVARELQRVMGEIFQENSAELFEGELVTITDVMVTKDLLIAKFYISIFKEEKRDQFFDVIQANLIPLRKVLANKIRNSFRRVPEIEFMMDDTLDEVFKMEQLFRSIKKDKGDNEA
jgi:ribosome-binding factor A|tara:strand:+ start:408 stop:785 length:378 start_codon:yes stop_codon:yes gene_type:complete